MISQFLVKFLDIILDTHWYCRLLSRRTWFNNNQEQSMKAIWNHLLQMQLILSQGIQFQGRMH